VQKDFLIPRILTHRLILLLSKTKDSDAVILSLCVIQNQKVLKKASKELEASGLLLNCQ
jgi:hypothetical protein